MQPLTAADPESRSPDLIAQNIAQLKQLFPEALTEGRIDFDVLRQLLGDSVEEAEEKYGLNWHGKRAARRRASTLSTGTLRPETEDSIEWDTTQNMFVEGENLEVLKLLQRSYTGRVKAIYIDPPYNTGKDFIYPDDYRDNIENFQTLMGWIDDEGVRITSLADRQNTRSSGRFHTNWLNMIYPTLRIARNLLSANGVIMISIDEHELHNLRMICDDIFGEECFVACLTILTNPKGRSQDKYFATNHEYVVIYSKEILPKGFFSVAKEEDQIEAEYPEEDEGGKYRLLELRNTHREFGRHNRKNLYYPLYVNVEGEVFLRVQDELFEVLPNWDDGYEGCWTWEPARTERDIEIVYRCFCRIEPLWVSGRSGVSFR